MQHNKPWVINTLNIRPYENFKTRLEEFLIKKKARKDVDWAN